MDIGLIGSLFTDKGKLNMIQQNFSVAAQIWEYASCPLEKLFKKKRKKVEKKAWQEVEDSSLWAAFDFKKRSSEKRG